MLFGMRTGKQCTGARGGGAYIMAPKADYLRGFAWFLAPGPHIAQQSGVNFSKNGVNFLTIYADEYAQFQISWTSTSISM